MASDLSLLVPFCVGEVLDVGVRTRGVCLAAQSPWLFVESELVLWTRGEIAFDRREYIFRFVFTNESMTMAR